MAKSKTAKFAKKHTGTIIAVGGLALVLGLAVYAFSDRQRLYQRLEDKVLGGGSSDSALPETGNEETVNENVTDSSVPANSLNSNHDDSVLDRVRSIATSAYSIRNNDRQQNTLSNLTRNQIVNLRSYLSQPKRNQQNSQLNQAVKDLQKSAGFKLARSASRSSNSQATATYLTSKKSFDRIAKINNGNTSYSGLRSSVSNSRNIQSKRLSTKTSDSQRAKNAAKLKAVRGF